MTNPTDIGRGGGEMRQPARAKMQPIILMRSHCTEYGHCWSAANPYYDKHYRTKEEAARAATKIKKKLAAKWGATP